MRNLYLDVDGVFNAFSDKPPRNNTGWTGQWGQDKIDGFAVLWSHELVDRLNTLDAHPDIQIVWATDWLVAAPEKLAPLVGLLGTHWAVLGASEARTEVHEPWWKMEEIEKHILETNPEHSVWVDDNIKFARGIQDWTRSRGTTFSTINPNPHHGITKKNMKMIENLLRLTPEED